MFSFCEVVNPFFKKTFQFVNLIIDIYKKICYTFLVKMKTFYD